MNSLDNSSVNWHQASNEQIAEISQGSRPLLFLISLSLVLFLIWAAWCEIDEVTRGMGKVIPSSQMQEIQNLEGGIVNEVLVSEGEIVNVGQVLLVMDDTRLSANRDSQRANQYALRARMVRLRSEIEGVIPVMPLQLSSEVPELAHSELELYQSRQQELASTVAVFEQQEIQQKQQLEETRAEQLLLERRLNFLSEELKLSELLARDGAVSKFEILRLERQVSDTRGERQIAIEAFSRIQAQIRETSEKVSEVKLSFVNQARTEMNEVLAQLEELSAKQVAVTDQVDRTSVRSPVKGVVKRILINTEGGVVQPGVTMIEIIPINDTLEVEARIRPEDIAFLYPGQKAMVRFTAYDFTIYGGLEGELTHISADTILNENGESNYLVRIKTDSHDLGGLDNRRPIIAGMVATVDILTGKKTLLDYLLKPVLKARHLAFTER
ncbi:HlyD family type I secretion periplasmic adaptor subunit [Endozoicomonas sp. OPT23]|uniref:HlyD family type I secretion periplasmic adaptor subunit n=1 Tax=Endozoicomonas sp. OPT23 TaxID=2072845 RepID=UPI00129BD9EB|nr:HlyD family type I secretion periplasmic adaptor subunit [Endozoicomonas sp. OPT23]MRI35079.1 HlyD family type I secretion periplasmic adaptor subunit [Endozoicomonas sp. OPT23]